MPVDHPLRLRSRAFESVVEVVVAGDLEMSGVFSLELEVERLMSAPGVRVVCFDLAGVEFIDSTGLGALLSIRDAARARDIQFRISRCSGAVGRILDLTGTRSTLGGTGAS